MKIAVCMKQVPAYSEGNMDEKTGLIIRSGLEAVVNSYDLPALETALRIKEQTGASVDVYTMGPESAGQVLREAYALGADGGYLISDRAFGGADVLATAYTLMQAITSQSEYQLILCGKQTTDGDTAQVGGALAAWLDIPHYAGIAGIEQVDSESLQVHQLFEDYGCSWKLDYPCLLAVEQDIFTPRMPSLKLRMAGRKKEIVRITLHDLADQEPEHYGLKGSATRVKKIFPPLRTDHHEPVELSGTDAAAYILKQYREISGAEEDRHGT